MCYVFLCKTEKHNEFNKLSVFMHQSPGNWERIASIFFMAQRFTKPERIWRASSELRYDSGK